MKKMDVLFSEVQKLQISDMSGITGQTVSNVSRAAMYLGMMQIRALAAQDVEKAIDLISINSQKSK